MKIRRTALLALSMLAAAHLVSAQSPTDLPVVVVSGEGRVKAAPDQAWVQVGAESRSKSPKDAQLDNAVAMTAVQQRLTGLGIAAEAIRTVVLDLQMEYDYANGRQTPKGYVARNTIEVRVDDLAKLGDVLDASVGSGATAIHGLRFDLKRRAVLEREALQRASADALSRAEAAAVGVKRVIDRVVKVEESGNARPIYQQQPMAVRAMEQSTVTPVSAGEIEIRAQVTLTATIK